MELETDGHSVGEAYMRMRRGGAMREDIAKARALLVRRAMNGVDISRGVYAESEKLIRENEAWLRRLEGGDG